MPVARTMPQGGPHSPYSPPTPTLNDQVHFALSIAALRSAVFITDMLLLGGSSREERQPRRHQSPKILRRRVCRSRLFRCSFYPRASLDGPTECIRTGASLWALHAACYCPARQDLPPHFSCNLPQLYPSGVPSGLFGKVTAQEKSKYRQICGHYGW